MSTLSTRVARTESALTGIEQTLVSMAASQEALGAAVMALLDKQAPAKSVTSKSTSRKVTKAQTAKAQKSEDFVTWVRETAAQRKARKDSNAQMATWLREKGLPTGGTVWTLAKDGERSMSVLRKAAKADKAAHAKKA